MSGLRILQRLAQVVALSNAPVCIAAACRAFANWKRKFRWATCGAVRTAWRSISTAGACLLRTSVTTASA